MALPRTLFYKGTPKTSPCRHGQGRLCSPGIHPRREGKGQRGCWRSCQEPMPPVRPGAVWPPSQPLGLLSWLSSLHRLLPHAPLAPSAGLGGTCQPQRARDRRTPAKVPGGWGKGSSVEEPASVTAEWPRFHCKGLTGLIPSTGDGKIITRAVFLFLFLFFSVGFAWNHFSNVV